MTLRTTSDLCMLIKEFAGRGTFYEKYFGSIVAYVPLWKVKKMKEAATHFTPLGVYIDVKPLSFFQHFTVFNVKAQDQQ